MNFGLSLPTLPILHHNFTEKTEELDNFLHRNSETLSLRDQVILFVDSIFFTQRTISKKAVLYYTTTTKPSKL
jgi:hypothetical protein